MYICLPYVFLGEAMTQKFPKSLKIGLLFISLLNYKIHYIFCCCSLAKSCPTLCNPMDSSIPGFPVLCYLWEFAQIHVHWVDYIIYIRRRQWHPTPVLLPGKSYGRRSLVGCSPWGCEESDMTERLHFHFSLSCIGYYPCLKSEQQALRKTVFSIVVKR